MILTPEELILIGALDQNQGFQILLTALKAEEDDILDEIATATSDEEERRLLGSWRAYRRLLARMQVTTTMFREHADAAFNGLTPEIKLAEEDELE